MSRIMFLGVFLLATVILVTPATAQDVPDWTPPTTQMPAMPTADDLRGNWQSNLSSWFRGLDRVTGLSTSGLRAVPEGRGPDGRALYVRFNSGHMPVAAWTDRSGDGRADNIEIFRNGRVMIQLTDSNYTGQANVLRFYHGDGSLAREKRY